MRHEVPWASPYHHLTLVLNLRHDMTGEQYLVSTRPPPPTPALRDPLKLYMLADTHPLVEIEGRDVCFEK